jgi:hypothetical protein
MQQAKQVAATLVDVKHRKMNPSPLAPSESDGRQTPVTKSSSSKGSHQALTPAERRVLRHLWSKMTAIYGYRWASAFGDSPEREGADAANGPVGLTDAGTVWAEGLTGLSPQSIAAGVRRAVFSANGFPPTLPEFRAMCLGVPPLARVQLLLGRQDQGDDPWLQGFIRLVLRNIDTWRLDHDDPKSFTFAVRDAYGLAREHVMSGGDVPPAPAGYLAGPSKKREKPVPAPDHVVEEHMSQIRELLYRSRGEETGHGS